MRSRLAAFLFFAGIASVLHGQNLSVEVANLREDVRLLTQKTGELQLRIEQLERENTQLAEKSAGAAKAYATLAQLNDAVADLEKQIRTASATTKSDTLQQVSVQLEKLAKQTNAALDAVTARPGPVSAAGNSAPATAPTFRDDYPREGVEYVVDKGDTLAVIAKKTGGKQSDIINANKLADPSKIRVGQKLFIPLAK